MSHTNFNTTVIRSSTALRDVYINILLTGPLHEINSHMLLYNILLFYIEMQIREPEVLETERLLSCPEK